VDLLESLGRSNLPARWCFALGFETVAERPPQPAAAARHTIWCI
jgi:hypothetical protein